MTDTDAIALGALIVASGALLVSLAAYRQTLTSLSLSIASGGFEGPKLYVTNNSPHAVTVTGLGIVKPDGSRCSLLDASVLRIRIDPRDEHAIDLNDDMAGHIRRSKGRFDRIGLYVSLATQHRFYTVSRLRIATWWVRGWFDGSRRIQKREP